MRNIFKYIRTNRRIIENMSKKLRQDNTINGYLLNKNSNFENLKVKFLPLPEKSVSDKKDYRVIKLENGLTALLISDTPILSETSLLSVLEANNDISNSDSSDSESEDSSSSGSSAVSDEEQEIVIKDDEKLAACALCVGVGSFSDPDEIPGLAHFLEHMVFMGSDKYPKENEFDAFIKRKGGSNNASTECEYTTFYFECQELYLRKSMDMLSNFFISPLMKREAIARERQAIESEFQMNLSLDDVRKEQLLCTTAASDNPARKFMWGNLITLRDNVDEDHLYKAVHDFRKRHYSSHRMTLTIQARLPLNILQQWVEECFAQIPNNNLPPLEFKPEVPFQVEKFAQIFYVKPIKDVCEVDISWVVPSTLKLYKSKPLEYLGWIIGHEGRGSLVSYFRKNVQALEISAGIDESGCCSNSIYTIFTITISLTNKGFENIKDVLSALFSYLNMLRKYLPSERIFKEIQSIDYMTFQYFEEEEPVDNVETLAANMQFYPPEHYLTGSELYYEYKPEEIIKFLNLLLPNKANITIMDNKVIQNFKLDKKEEWFGTEYTCREIPQDWIDTWQKIEPYQEFFLPEPNKFITTDFTLINIDGIAQKQKYPINLFKNDLMEIWHKQDTKFLLPQAYIYLNFMKPLTENTLKNAVLTNFVISVIYNLLQEDLYPANMAQLGTLFKQTNKGFQIRVFGFNQQLPLVLNTIVTKLKTCMELLTEELFEASRTKQIRRYTNLLKHVEYFSKDIRMSALFNIHWPLIDQLKLLPLITMDELKECYKQLFNKVFVQCLVQGNISGNDSEELCKNFINDLNCTSIKTEELPVFQVYQIPKGEQCIRVNSMVKADKNCVTTNYYQFGPGSLRDYCILELLVMLIEEPLFDMLRTQEQLGYDVSASVRDTDGILGFSVTVVSQVDKVTVDHVEERITNFLKDHFQVLLQMAQQDYDEIAHSLIKLKKCADIHLKQEVNRNWIEIVSCNYLFDKCEKQILLLPKIKFEEVKELFNNQTGNDMRKLIIQVVGHDLENCDNSQNDENEIDACKEIIDFIDQADGKSKFYFITDLKQFKSNLLLHPPNKCM